MIQSFKDADTKELFEKGSNKRWNNIAKVATRKLIQIEASLNLNDLRVGQHSVRVNDQFRICFVWKEDGAHQVEITHYH